MARFLAVIHKWHVDSKGFDVHELEAETSKQADNEAAHIAHHAKDRCLSTDYILIDLNNYINTNT